MDPLPPAAKHPVETPPPDAIVEYLFGPFRLDVASMQVSRGDEVVNLTPKAFDTLLVLIRNRHRLVRKDELMSAVWADSFVSEDSLTQNITALRRALGDDSHQPEYISTIPRRGYRFIAPLVERGPADPPAPGATAVPAVASTGGGAPRRLPGPAGQELAALAVAVGRRGGRPRGGLGDRVNPRHAPPAPRRPSCCASPSIRPRAPGWRRAAPCPPIGATSHSSLRTTRRAWRTCGFEHSMTARPG